MPTQCKSCLAINGTGADRCFLAAICLPKQKRTTILAEAALRLVTGTIPGKGCLLIKMQVLVFGGCEGAVVSGLLAALGAMAGDDQPEFARDAKGDFTTQAACGF